MGKTELEELSLNVNFFDNEQSEISAQFKSVVGLTVDIDTEEILKNGEIKFRHSFPSRTRFPNLILKGGVLKDLKAIDWCKKAIEHYQFSPTDIKVRLVNSKKESILAWNIIHAYPIKWTLKKQETEENNIVIETMELAYNYFKLV